MIRKIREGISWTRYAWGRYVRGYDAVIEVVIKGREMKSKTQINKTADDNAKLVFWAMRGAINDLMAKSAKQESVGLFIGLAMAALEQEGAVPEFAIPKPMVDMMAQAEKLKQAGVIPPCGGKPGECSEDECKTCLQNPHLPTDDVTLGELTKGAKF